MDTRRTKPEAFRSRRALGVPRTVFVLAAVLLALSLSGGLLGSDTRTVSLTAKKFEWTPSRIEVKVGETIELSLSSEDVKHGFVSKDLGIEKVKFTKDRPVSVRFTATEPGTYHFKCADFCGRGHRRMKGEIIVRP